MSNSNQYIFLSGLPRTGSNLLSSILNQNPKLHSEGVSALCRILWDLNGSLKSHMLYNEMAAVRRNTDEDRKRIVLGVMDNYYNLENRVIFDKNTSWTLGGNLDLVYEYVTDSPKVIVMTRKILDIARSYIRIHIDNGATQAEAEETVLNLTTPGRNPLMRPIAGLLGATINDKGQFLFIDYDDLLADAPAVIESVYAFCELEPYDHTFSNLVLQYPEDETVILKGLMGVRPEIGRRVIQVDLSEAALEKIDFVQKLIDDARAYPGDPFVIERAIAFYNDNIN